MSVHFHVEKFFFTRRAKFLMKMADSGGWDLANI
jgi:hypothetical protein